MHDFTQLRWRAVEYAGAASAFIVPIPVDCLNRLTLLSTFFKVIGQAQPLTSCRHLLNLYAALSETDFSIRRLIDPLRLFASAVLAVSDVQFLFELVRQRTSRQYTCRPVQSPDKCVSYRARIMQN